MMNSLNEIEPKIRNLFFAASFIFYLVFLFSTGYNGGIRVDFSFMGSYLFVANMAFLVFFNNKPFSFKLIPLGCILLLNLVWNTYLFNCFLSDAWIFT
jgi:hypothetical protein